MTNLGVRVVTLAACMIARGVCVYGQAVEDPVVLKIDVENLVSYRGTVFDATKIGKDPGPTTQAEQVPFVPFINIGDIVAINGKPAKGIWTMSGSHTTPFRVSPQPGQFIADFDSSATFYCTWRIWSSDGTYLGMIRDDGADLGHAVTGALGGFYGAIGTHSAFTAPPDSRFASNAEDPANRRKLGGAKTSHTLYLYPRVRPAVLVTANGPAITHADYSPLTEANPARPGELLILAATGLGPVKPNLEPPGAIQFSGPPYQEVNSPVSVVFNGKELPVVNKIGWPGQKSVYRVDFQVPSDATAGAATLQLIAAWIPGPTVTIPVGAR